MPLSKDDKTLEEIAAGCKKGHNTSFRQLVSMYSGRFYGYFYSKTFDKQVSEDLLSEFYMKIVKGIKSYKGDCFEAWLQKVASNVYYDYLRKHIREHNEHKKYCEQAVYLDDCSDDDFGKEGFEQLREALASLDDDSRELVSMRYFSDMSFKEIAAATERPIGTVLAKIHRAVGKLKQKVGVEK